MMIPSYTTNEWRVTVKQFAPPEEGIEILRISVVEDGRWHDYWVPPDDTNADYVQYQAWVADGNVAEVIY